MPYLQLTRTDVTDNGKPGGARIPGTESAVEGPVLERSGRLLVSPSEQSRRQASAADRRPVLADQKRGAVRR